MHLSNRYDDRGSVFALDDTNWSLRVAQNELAQALRVELFELARKAVSRRIGEPYHRSRYATTWAASIGGAVKLGVFVRLMEGPHGIMRLKRIVKGSRGAHIERITQALNDSGFSAPRVLLHGANRKRAELLITQQADGDGPLRTLARLANGPLAQKWAVLRGFGRELARFHRCGFVHGDLTPFNIFFIHSEPIRFALIDNERTLRVTVLRGRRPQLRNLVQLGHFALPHLSRTDRLRVLGGYSEMLSPPARRALTRRVVAMLDRRIKRDRGLAKVPPMREETALNYDQERP
jgi:hypothetical protein